jgi:hypothetical protein
MQTEFIHTQAGVFTKEDYVKIIGQDIKPLDDCTDDEINIFHRLFSLDDEVRAYMMNRFKNGVKETRELVRLCSRKFFGKATQQPDIDENGKLHKEI